MRALLRCDEAKIPAVWAAAVETGRETMAGILEVAKEMGAIAPPKTKQSQSQSKVRVRARARVRVLRPS